MFCLPPDELKLYQAKPIYSDDSNNDSNNNNIDPITTTLTTTTTTTTLLQTKKLVSLQDNHQQQHITAGIEIGNWRITSQSSRICSDNESTQLQKLLQKECCASRTKFINPPEIVHVGAHVTLAPLISSSNGRMMLQLKINPIDALVEWARSQHDEVLILNEDGYAWQKKNIAGDKCRSDHVINRNELYYDWTYSTPYCCARALLLMYNGSSSRGGATSCAQSNSNATTTTTILQTSDIQCNWKPTPTSPIPYNILADTSQKILYYNTIHLYEDDLHDSGECVLLVKLRVMPRCFFILQRYFLRVDHVIIRVRDVRYFCDTTTTTLMREITWREVQWNKLKKYNLPDDVISWRMDNNNSGNINNNSDHASISLLISKIPTVPKLPDDIMPFATMDLLQSTVSL